MQLARIQVEYDGKRIRCTAVIPPDAHHAGLAPVRINRWRVQPIDGLDESSADDLAELVTEVAERLRTEGRGAWGGTTPLF